MRFIISLLAVASLGATACDVPVFRYALEQWPADYYQVTVFHQGAALSSNQQAVVAALSNACDDGMVNMSVAQVDVGSGLTGNAEKLWKAQAHPDLPWVTVQYPAITGLETLAAKGSLTATFAQQLVDSPVRRDLRQRILKGDSIVWLMLESGDRKRDDKVATLLQTESKRLAGLIELPPVDPNDPRTEVNVTLKIAFSLLRMSRSDPAEQILVSQLVNLNPRLAEAKGPLVFPVFGRGRALCGLTEEELTADNLEEMVTFLTGACSCEVKAMNPGVDLLIAADWDAVIEGRVVQEPEMPPLVSLSQLAAQAQKPVATVPAPNTPSPTNSLIRNLIVAIGLGVAAVGAGTLWLRNRSRKP